MRDHSRLDNKVIELVLEAFTIRWFRYCAQRRVRHGGWSGLRWNVLTAIKLTCFRHS